MKTALILAAGLGTRLKPLTDTLPKALVPVNGKPLLCHLIEKLKAAGITEIVVNVHHFADQIVSYLQENDNFGVEIRVSDERDFLRETGGGIRHAEPLLIRAPHEEAVTDAPEDSFLVHNVDILSDLDLSWFESSVRPDALSTLLVSDRETRRYLLFDDAMRLMGWTDRVSGEVRSPFEEIDPAKCKKRAFAGIHLISNRIFSAFEALSMPERFSVIDFYIQACARYKIYGAEPEALHLIDAGKADSLDAAGRFLRDRSHP